MVDPSITTGASSAGGFFIFGSWLKSQTPEDLDLLFVYDQRVCSPEQAISVRHALKERGARLGLPTIHVVLLSRTESAQCRFVELEGAVLLHKWADEHRDVSLQRLIDEVAEHFGNPNGIPSLSPGLVRSTYPG